MRVAAVAVAVFLLSAVHGELPQPTDPPSHEHEKIEEWKPLKKLPMPLNKAIQHLQIVFRRLLLVKDRLLFTRID